MELHTGWKLMYLLTDNYVRRVDGLDLWNPEIRSHHALLLTPVNGHDEKGSERVKCENGQKWSRPMYHVSICYSGDARA
jgi:hypothetical protein